HRQPHALGSLQRCVDDRAHRKKRDVVEGSDVDEKLEEEPEDDAAADIEVQLILGIVGPSVEPTVLARDQQADAERHQADSLDDALDDDHLDESVVLAADASKLAPQAVEV